jgi:hypothetical protein
MPGGHTKNLAWWVWALVGTLVAMAGGEVTWIGATADPSASPFFRMFFILFGLVAIVFGGVIFKSALKARGNRE